MANKTNSKGTWNGNDIDVVKIVYNGKVVNVPKRPKDKAKKTDKK